MMERYLWFIVLSTALVALVAGLLVWNGGDQSFMNTVEDASLIIGGEVGKEEELFTGNEDTPDGTQQQVDTAYGIERSDMTQETYSTDGRGGEDGVDRANRVDMVASVDMPDAAELIDRKNALVHVTVPFQAQAPFGDWSQPWEDACEEASLVLANRFARGITTLTREEMRDEILQLVRHQNEQYGDYKDSNAARTAEIGEAVYGLNTEVRAVSEIEDLINILREGNLIIAPMAGRELHNPNFTTPGPLYHMIVIRGFDDDAQEFIVNDIGTRRGEKFHYAYKVIWNALHDFTGDKEKILEGGKRIIAVYRN